MTTYTESHSHIDHSWNTDGWIGWDMTQSMELKRMQSYETQ